MKLKPGHYWERYNICWRKLWCECSCGYLGSYWAIGKEVRIFVVKWEWQMLLMRCVKPGWSYDDRPMVMWNGEKKTTAHQRIMKAKANGKRNWGRQKKKWWTWCNKVSSSSNSTLTSPRAELNEEGELVRLTSLQRDIHPEGKEIL